MTIARTIPARAVRLVLLLALMVSATSASFQTALAAPSGAPQAQATSSVVTLNVASARTAGGHNVGEPINQYQYIINEDNTGNPNDSDANCRPYDANGTLVNPTLANCQWPSIHKMPGNAPIVTQGTEADFPLNLDSYISAHPGAAKFLISVVADGYKIGGTHFTLTDLASGPVRVELEPNPLPTTTFRAMVFNDNASPNGAIDVPGEDGLDGFEGIINDVLGQISTDWFGNPLCTEYAIVDGQPDPDQPIPGTGGICLSGDSNHDGKVNPPTMTVGGVAQPNPDYDPTYPADDPADQGMIVIPNLGSNRVAAMAVAPDDSNWVQTTTLEGWHDFDTWMIEGATGYDTEFLYQNELFPWTVFGFVKPTALPASNANNHVKGTVWGSKIYVPAAGGLPITNLGIMGTKPDFRVNRPWIALSDLNNGDQMIYAGRGNPDGTFDIAHVPPGDYLVTLWDDAQSLILDGLQIQVTVNANGDTCVGDDWTINNVVTHCNVGLQGWWTRVNGYVFIDNGKAADGTIITGTTPSNIAAPYGNGQRDCYGPDRGPDPKSGLPRGADPRTCEAGLPQQPIGFKMRGNSLMQHGTTGITTDNNGYYEGKQVYPLGAWIVEEVYNDRYKTSGITYQADNQPTATTVLGQGVDVNVLPIIGLSGRLDWGVLPYGRNENGGIAGTVSYDVTRNELDPRYAASEDWQPGVPGLQVDLFKPVKCGTTSTNCDSKRKYQVESDGSYTLGDANGQPTTVDHPIDSYITESWDRPTGCVARDVNGNPIVQQALPTDPTAECVEAPMDGIQFGPLADAQGTTDANFGASVDGNYGFGDLTPGDYLVKVEIPTDPIFNRPLYKVTREEDINVFNGDNYVPQVPPPACAGALHTVDVAGVAPDGPGATDNPNFRDEGGSPWEGKNRPLCDVKLIPVQNGKSIAPNFNLFTDVPLPARYMGLLVDNLNFSTNSKSTAFGEVAGIPHTPVGIYDFNGRLEYTLESDANGIWEVLMPSSLQINCPTPSGVCPNMYRFVGNDPGQPYHRNPNWNPQYQTISAPFEAWPGVINPADLAPMPVATTIELQGAQFNALAACVVPSAAPKFFAVDKPYVVGSGSIVVSGDAFGSVPGAVTLDGAALPVAGWSNNTITATIPATTAAGPHQLLVSTSGGQNIVNGLTVHVVTALPNFPENSVLDNFNNRGNGSLGTNWAGATNQNNYRIQSNEVQVRASNANVYWNAGTAFGANQEAFFTFTDVSTTASEQALVLKRNTNGSSMIEVVYHQTANANGPANSVTVETLDTTSDWVVRGAPITGVSFAAGDQFGARTLADGTVNVYKNGTLVGTRSTASGATPWPNAGSGGRIGVTFQGANGGAANDARFDNFGGGNVSIPANAYMPTILEVGPGRAFDPTITTIDPVTGLPYEHALQNALDTAANVANALVVVYPNAAVANVNPAGEYFENIVVHSPVKLQGVGPGGVYTDTNNVVHVVPGSILDGVGYSPDATPSTDWYALVASLLTPDPNGGDPTAIGNPNISDGEVVYVLPTSTSQFGSAYKASIDGFTIQGGDQLGFPANLNETGGGQVSGGRPTFQGDVPTQGGAIYVHGYAHYLQIMNNVIQSNGGAYAGGIRVGTPTYANNNDNVRIAYNRIIANGGTNLAGAIGLFQGANGYEVDHNDLCGNYSSEYGGAISHFGLSPNGKIHDNRIYFNQSVDEAGGIMIGGELPVNPNANYGTPNGPQGAGAVNVYNNLIQSNIAGDDGGGLRFLMAGNFPYNVYNNLIVNNVSTHEGGGVALDDAPNVRFYNNTVMKNISTDTAATAAFHTHYVAGLSTGGNSVHLQATLPGGSPSFSNPLMFNNIFWDNRSGSYNETTATVEGIGIAGDATPIYYWDMGDTSGALQLSPTNSVLNGGTDHSNVAASASNRPGVNPQVAAMYDLQLSVFPWLSPNRPAPVIISINQPGVLQGDYHLAAGSQAIDLGATSKPVPSYQQPAATLAAPVFDIDNQLRPSGALCLPDSGADESQTGGVCTDLAITKSDGVSSILAGAVTTYTITIVNNGPSAVTNAPVTDNFPAALTVNSWTCTTTGGGNSCVATGSGSNRTGTVSLTPGASATFTARTTVATSATGSVANTASVAAPAGVVDSNPANNSATDTDSIIAMPTLSVLDTFNRAAANNLNTGAPAGVNWSQGTLGGAAAIQVNTNQALCTSALCALGGQAIWNGTTNNFGVTQGAAFTMTTVSNGMSLILKASGGTAAGPSNFVRVRYNAGQIIVETTTNGLTYTTRGSFTATFAAGDRLTAMADASGTVYVWRTSGATTTYVGSATTPNTGGGRIGIQLPNGARVDNFSGGTLP